MDILAIELRGLPAALLILVILIYTINGLAHAHEIDLTIYDDGRSCPGNCDAHVVLNAAENGTAHAFKPGSSPTVPERCKSGELCRICFSHDAASCMTTMYRGGGPPAGKFDFTPAFYDRHCTSEESIPFALRKQCNALEAQVRLRGYDTRINCIADPARLECADRMSEALAMQEADVKEYELCRELGQDTYNRRQGDDSTRRMHSCAYSKLSLGGPNSAGLRWKVLLPGACRRGTFVGRDGLDCCSSNLRFAAGIHPECTPYFPRP
jgi:hypothetical protein